MTQSSYGQVSFLPDLMREPDRNFEQGGRSFYFFDFDDNVMHLDTKIVLFRRGSDEEREISTTEYASVHGLVGRERTAWSEWEIRTKVAEFGSYRNFRDLPGEARGGDRQPLVRDVREALANAVTDWRGPSWAFFVHAVNQSRPISLITARGPPPPPLRRAVDLLAQTRDLPANPNYLSLYPVTHPDVQKLLGDPEGRASIAELKKEAIKRAVADAFECFGANPSHRFGMSDDDPANVRLIAQAFRELKQDYPDNAFFVFNTHGRQLVREEILLDGSATDTLKAEQIELFKG